MAETSGLIPFTYKGETFETWYKVVGDLKSSARPLVVVHGGPAIPSIYLYAHAELYESRGIPVVFYNQLGCGRSTHLPDKPKEFWTVDLFMAELDTVLSFLGIAQNFDLYGHSWGGMLVSDYVATFQPKGLRRLVIAGAPASMSLYMAAANKLVDSDRYPAGFGNKMRKLEQEGRTGEEEYVALVRQYTHNHICLSNPWPQQLVDAFAEMNKDPTVLVALFGEYELSCNGNVASWTIIDRLNRVSCPTLVINGVEDSAQDECVEPFMNNIPKAKWIRYGNSSHMPWFEEKQLYFDDLGDFLQSE